VEEEEGEEEGEKGEEDYGFLREKENTRRREGGREGGRERLIHTYIDMRHRYRRTHTQP